jgi:succinate dehydrogenase/fumarate reductase flavoprotein subunit
MSEPTHTAHKYDCIVVGSGHAGSCAALSVTEHGCARVLILDKCPEAWAGGNGYFTAGAHRTVHTGLADLLTIAEHVPAELASCIDVDPYSAEDFADDIVRVSEGRSDARLVRAVVDGSRAAIEWLRRAVGVAFILSFDRQACEVDGRLRFWGGVALSTRDGGKGLIAAHRAALERAGVETWFETPVRELIRKDGAVVGVVVERDGKRECVYAAAIVMAAGGYESSAALRKLHLGEGWENARVSDYSSFFTFHYSVPAGSGDAIQYRGLDSDGSRCRCAPRGKLGWLPRDVLGLTRPRRPRGPRGNEPVYKVGVPAWYHGQRARRAVRRRGRRLS